MAAMAVKERGLAVPACVRKALLDVTQARGWKDPQFLIEAGSSDGDGFLSVLFRIVIRNKDESLFLMCKAIMASMENSAFIENAFKSEIFVYNKALPAMEKITRLRNPLPWPRAYPTDPQLSCLVMEDLRPEGFAISKRGDVLDVERCRLLVAQLGRFHGAGMALDRLRPDLIADFRKIVDDPLRLVEVKKVFDPFLQSTLDAADLIADRFPKGSPVYEKLKELFTAYPEDFYKDVLTPDPEGGNTIVHGDLHVNNVLFQQNKAGEWVGCRLIDFQMVGYSWPVAEVNFILLSMTEKATRDEHWDALMRAYHDELQATLRAAGIEDPEAVYSWTTFQRQLRRSMPLSVCMVPPMLHTFCDDDAVKEIQSTMSQLTGEKGSVDAGTIRIKGTPELKRRFGDAVQSAIEWGFM